MSYFLMPMIGDGPTLDTASWHEYRTAGASFACAPIGDSCVYWGDLTLAQENAVAAHSDVVLIPPLDSVVTAGTLAAVRAAVESLNIPGDWIQIGMIVLAGNLNKTMAQLSATVRNGLAAAVDSMGLDRTAIVGTTTLRAALLNIGQQFVAGRIIAFGDL